MRGMMRVGMGEDTGEDMGEIEDAERHRRGMGAVCTRPCPARHEFVYESIGCLTAFPSSAGTIRLS